MYSKESNPPAYVAWRAGTRTLFVLPARQATWLAEYVAWNRFLGILNFTNLHSGYTWFGLDVIFLSFVNLDCTYSPQGSSSRPCPTLSTTKLST